MRDLRGEPAGLLRRAAAAAVLCVAGCRPSPAPQPAAGGEDVAAAATPAAIPATDALPAATTPPRSRARSVVTLWNGSVAADLCPLGDSGARALDAFGLGGGDDEVFVGAGASSQPALHGDDAPRLLLVAAEPDLRGTDEAEVRRALAAGAVVFVDAWSGDADWLASLVPGGTVRDLRADDAVLARPNALGALPPAHSDPNPRIAGVEAAGVVRVVATVQDTLCHDCSCEANTGRKAFAANLLDHARRLAEARAPQEGPVVRVVSASVEGADLRATAEFVNDTAEDVAGRLELLPRAGACVASAAETVRPGERRTVTLRARLAQPFDAVEHRLVASRVGSDQVVRAVARLSSLAGADDVRLVGTRSYAPGAPLAVRLALRNGATGAATLGTARVALVASDGTELCATEGCTDAEGRIDVALRVPDGARGDAKLVAATRTALREDRLECALRSEESLGAHVFLDLPVRRPGERVRLRALVVRQPVGRPAPDTELRATLVGERDTELAAATLRTDASGVGTAELTIPPGTATGDCEVRLVADGSTIAGAPLRVERFEVPRFHLELAPLVRTAQPGGTVEATVRASRFDGAPLARAEVSATLRTAAAGALPFARWEGLTGDDGEARIRIAVPGDLSDRDSDGFALECAVVDAGGRRVRNGVALAWARESRGVVSVVTPGGPLLPGVASRVLLRTRLPEGATLRAAAGDAPAATVTVDALGFAELPVTPSAPELKVTVGDASFGVEIGSGPLAWEIGRRVAAEGGSVPLRVRRHDVAREILVDVVRGDVLVATRRVVLPAGETEVVVPLPEGVSGLLRLEVREGAWPASHAESRAVYVVPAERLRVRVEPTSAEYAPGAPIGLDLAVTDAAGRGVPGIVALRVADEAVLSLVRAARGGVRGALAADAVLHRTRDADSGTTAAAVAALAALGALPSAEQRMADTLLSRLDTASASRMDVTTLPGRERAHVARVREQFTAFVADFERRALDVLASDRAPAPSDGVPGIVAALRAAAAAGAFGDDGLLDPWGSALGVAARDALPPTWDRERPVWSGNALIGIRSRGPDGAPGTADDVSHVLEPEQVLALHVAWVRSHGLAFDETAFVESIGGVLEIGGGAFGGRRGGSRSLRAGGGGKKSAVGSEIARPAARSRRFFPESLLFLPAVRTDAAGRAHVDVTAPDALTTWRVEAVASDARGGAADGTATFRTTLPFVAEIDAPPALLAGDEVEVPVLLRWTGAAREPVTVSATVSGAGRLAGPARTTVEAPASGEASVGVRVLATEPGVLRVAVRADSASAADASEREIAVGFAGRAVASAVGGVVTDSGATFRAARTRSPIPGSERLELRLRPGPVADLLDGAEGLARRPYGCFEQTSSCVFPTVLAYSYLVREGNVPADVKERFESAIDEGVARLLSFEIDGGGFDWFGRAPAKLLLSAYGLHEWVALEELDRRLFRDSRGRDTGAALVASRTAAWIVSRQGEDGSFPAADAPHTWQGSVSSPVAATAYVGWALRRAGDGDARVAAAAGRAEAFVASHLAETTDPYALALAAVFLGSSETGRPHALDAARRLAAAGVRKDGALRIGGASASALHGRGVSAGVETTAVAALAALRLRDDAALPPAPLLAALAADRTGDGAWPTTQATVLSLLAIVEGRSTSLAPGTSVVVAPKGTSPRTLRIDDPAVTLVVDLGAAAPAAPQEVTVSHDGGGALGATLCASGAVPFGTKDAGAPSSLALSVTPAALRVARGGDLPLAIVLTNTAREPAAMPLVEIPLAGGFLADARSLAAVRALPGVERVEADAARIAIYLRELAPGAAFRATLGVSPRLRGKVTMAEPVAYAYYEPERRAYAKHARLAVE